MKLGKRTWWQLRSEHLDGDDVDDEDPDGCGEDVGLVVGLTSERDDADALGLHLAAVGVGSLQLSVHVLLEFLHVEHLKRRTGSVSRFAKMFFFDRKLDFFYFQVTKAIAAAQTNKQSNVSDQ